MSRASFWQVSAHYCGQWAIAAERRVHLGVAAALLGWALGVDSAAAQQFNQAIVFGDSTVDSGFYRALPNPGGGNFFNNNWAAAVAAGAGIPSSNPGAMNSQVLASYFGLTANPSNQAGGTNYATSGAKNVLTNNAQTGGFTQAIPTINQFANYLASVGGRANSDAIYLINSGSNDVSFARGQSGAGPHPANPTAFLESSAVSLAAAIASLQVAGAQYIVVAGQNYSFPLGGGAGNAATRQARLDYMTALWSQLASNGVNFIPADVNAVRLAIAADQTRFGFEFIDTNDQHTACTRPNPGVGNAYALLCSSNPAAPSHFANPTADQTRLFADAEGHLSTAGQKIFADYYYSLILAPSMISMLAREHSQGAHHDRWYRAAPDRSHIPQPQLRGTRQCLGLGRRGPS